MIKKISDRKELQNLKKAMNPQIQNNFYVEPFKILEYETAYC